MALFRLPAFGLLLAALTWCIALGESALGPKRVIASSGVAIATAGADSFSPFFSEDGRFLFFQSLANDLVPGDSDASALDLFRYQLSSGAMIRVSDGLLDWESPSVSSNGERVAYSAVRQGSRPVPDAAGILDIFVRDIPSGSTRLVSVSSNGIAGGNGDSRLPVLSSNGRFVAFDSFASDLAPVPQNAVSNAGPLRWVHIRDLESDRVIAARVPEDGLEGRSLLHSPSLDADGHRIAFTRDVWSGIRLSARVVVMDTLSGAVLWWSTNYESILPGRGTHCLAPQLSSNGRWVAFNVSSGRDEFAVVLHDLDAATDRVLNTNQLSFLPVSMSTDLSHLVFERPSQIGIWDLATDAIQFVPLGPPLLRLRDAHLAQAVIDARGSRLVYRTDVPIGKATSIVPRPQLYLRQLSEQESVLISANASGAPGSQEAIGDPAISPDGRWVAFQASDGDLVEGDRNRSPDVFLSPYHQAADPRERVLGYVDFRSAILDGDIPDFTCLLGTLVQETYATHPAIRAACDKAMSSHIAILSRDIEAAKKRYAPDAPWSAESVGYFIQGVLQGSFVFAKAKDGSAVARENLSHLRRYLESLFHQPVNFVGKEKS